MPTLLREGPYRVYVTSHDIGEPPHVHVDREQSLAWYPRLLHATPEQRAGWELSGAGFGVHWLEIDEDISVAGLLAGAPAPGVRVSSVA